MTRKLTKSDSLAVLKRAGVPVSCVLDIGVQHGTPDLMRAFPDAPHVLVEPIEEYRAKIAEAYRDIPHTLVEAAASDNDGEGRMHTTMQGGASAISHSWLSDEGRPVQVRRVDTIVREGGHKGPFLLKIDVEGAEIPGKILDGASGIMDQTTIVICEMVGSRFLNLANRIEAYGFVLWDIVESCYYDDVFWQCDAVFVRRQDVASNPALRPMSAAPFEPSKWWESHRG